MRKILYISSFVFFSFVLAYAWSIKPSSELEENLVRLHIIAASDSESDIRLKYLIRDELLSKTRKNGKFPSVAEMEATANSVLKKENAAYGARATLGRFFITRRNYGDFSLPCARYTAARIELGKATGSNWWCILSPPLCFTSSCISPKEELDEYLSDETGNILTDNINIKFRTIELFSMIRKKLEELY